MRAFVNERKIVSLWKEAVIMLIAFSAASALFAAPPKQKVILDTDMVECFDDGIAMLVLEKSPNIDLLGVTVVAGNTSMPHGVASGAKQLEIVHSKTPIYQGSRKGIRQYRCDEEFLKAEEAFAPVVSWAGYFRTYRDPKKYKGVLFDPMADWKDAYTAKYGSKPTYKYVYGPDSPDKNGNKDAVDFIVEQVNKYPGEIVIAAIGPLTNIARAIMRDPALPSKVKEIVYMGGAFYIPGNSSAAAEFNWWADPDAAKICIRAVWGDTKSESYKAYGNQMISGLEANEHTHGMPQAVFDKVIETTYPGLRELFIKNYNKTAPNNIWDVLAIGYIIDPSIVLSWNDDPVSPDGKPQKIYGVYVDVDTEEGPNYGRSLAYRRDKGPIGTQKAAIQNFIDEDTFWNRIVYPLLKDPAKK